jgi:RNA polymerase sigma-70 factor (ECF subfamily)
LDPSPICNVRARRVRRVGGIEEGVVRLGRAVQDVMDAAGPTPDDVVALYRRTVGEVHRYLSKLTAGDRALAEDLTQETYLALVRALPGSGPEVLCLPWLITTARHAFLQRLRAGRREQRRAERARSVVRETAGVDQAAVAADEANRLLRRLPEDQRAAVVLRYVDDLPVAEIARLLGRSVRATESLLARATSTIRRSVAKEAEADV